MESNKEYRFKDNQKEKEFHDKFKEMFTVDNEVAKTDLSAIIFGWKDASQDYPNQYLTNKEEDICLTLIQWLGSHVGQGFLKDCGFVLKDKKS